MVPFLDYFWKIREDFLFISFFKGSWEWTGHIFEKEHVNSLICYLISVWIIRTLGSDLLEQCEKRRYSIYSFQSSHQTRAALIAGPPIANQMKGMFSWNSSLNLNKRNVFWCTKFYGMMKTEARVSVFWFYNRHDWPILWENWQANVNVLHTNLKRYHM